MADLHPDNPYAPERFADPAKLAALKFPDEAMKRFEHILTRYPTKEAALLPELRNDAMKPAEPKLPVLTGVAHLLKRPDGFDQTLYELERYNGFGYRDRRPQVLSPYLWSFSNHYSRGKYVADGRFSDPSPTHGGFRDFDTGRTAVLETDRCECRGGRGKRIGAAVELERDRDVFQCRHRRQQMKRLENDAYPRAAQPG